MQRRPLLAAYLADRENGTGISPEDARRLDRVNYAFGVVRDGRVSGAHWRAADQLQALREANPDLQIVLSIGGWGAGGFSDACLTAEGRERFAQSAVALLYEHGFDGLDLDWEYPTIDEAGIDARPEDKFTFTKMMRLLRGKLDALSLATGRAYLLTMAVGCGKSTYARIMELPELATFLDEINLMTYDMRNGNAELTGHHTNLLPSPGDPKAASAAEAVELFASAGVPKEMLVLGAAFYGKGWTGVEGGGTGLHQPTRRRVYQGSLDYERLQAEYIGKNGFVRHWDEAACAPYLFDGSTFISYDDERSVAEKVRYAKAHGLRGVMYWEHQCDPSGALLRAMDEARS